jgi:two-component system sensor histidine kinase PilS (NtrC family)
MAPNQANTIYPCPFSKGYGIPTEQAWYLLKVFFIYRVFISALFIFLFYSHFDPSIIKTHDKNLYSIICYSYFAFSILSGYFTFKRLLNYSSQAQLAIFSDIVFIILLMHASGSVNGGMGILLVASTAAGGLLIGGRCALLFAAIASLSVLFEHIYSIFTHSTFPSFTYAGMLGASYFTTAFLSYTLAKRTEFYEKIASQHKQTIANLEELNQYIIQNLQSGIIICDDKQHIKMLNEAVLNIINQASNSPTPQYLTEISSQLSESFYHWAVDNNQNFALINLASHKQIHTRFSLITTQQDTFHMIILEDISLYNQQLQLSKLASLGRLTASIAHEIRNPLGAISHANQLLSEAPALESEDYRLTEIIQSHCLRVNRIIEDVLQLSRRQHSKREKIQLNLWLDHYIKGFIYDTGSPLDNFIISTQVTDLWTYMDTDHLKQILDNLCSNALKYGDTSNNIIIELNVFDSSPCITIFDHGEAINSETLSHLFEPFFTTSTSGTGLGLYISKELAELNQAKLSYASTDNNKNSFKLCLPKADSSKIEI